jgi:hypothetical protein
MAILRFFAGVLESLDQDQAKGFLVHVLNPIHRITDESGDLSAAQGESIGKSLFLHISPGIALIWQMI